MRVVAFRRAGDLPAAVAAVREAIATSAVTALPTETFYGLAVAPRDEDARARLFALKRRAVEKALPIVAASLAQLEELVVIPERWRRRLLEAWPAPFTVVLPAVGALPRGGATLAVRVPEHRLLRALLVQVGPLTATSANRSGLPPLDDPREVAKELGHGLALLLDGGPTPGGAASTLLDLTTTPPRLLRAGPFAPPPEWDVNGA
jgi:L-threonylcarbamoyladenylate synthase